MMFGMGLMMMLVYFHEMSVAVMMIYVGVCLSPATSVANCLPLLRSPLYCLPLVGRKGLGGVEIGVVVEEVEIGVRFQEIEMGVGVQEIGVGVQEVGVGLQEVEVWVEVGVAVGAGFQVVVLRWAVGLLLAALLCRVRRFLEMELRLVRALGYLAWLACVLVWVTLIYLR
jgi:hypothetical protein